MSAELRMCRAILDTLDAWLTESGVPLTPEQRAVFDEATTHVDTQFKAMAS